MPIVIDANVAIDWFLPARNDVAEIALDRVVSGGAVVPALWRWEVQDVLRRLSVAGRLKKPVELIRNELRELQIAIDDDLLSLFGDELAVSTRYGLSVYDASYLELALRLRIPLATNDRALAEAAKAASVEPLL
jgi:predicted nucleic acid-binding protein